MILVEIGHVSELCDCSFVGVCEEVAVFDDSEVAHGGWSTAGIGVCFGGECDEAGVYDEEVVHGGDSLWWGDTGLWYDDMIDGHQGIEAGREPRMNANGRE